MLKANKLLFFVVLVLGICLGSNSSAADTLFGYWPGQEKTPATHDTAAKSSTAMVVKAGMRPDDKSFPHVEDLETWTKANGWSKDTINTIIVANSDWRSYSSYHLLREPDNDSGKVTPEIVAEFLVNGMPGIRRLDDWWLGYLVKLKELGLPVHIVAK